MAGDPSFARDPAARPPSAEAAPAPRLAVLLREMGTRGPASGGSS